METQNGPAFFGNVILGYQGASRDGEQLAEDPNEPIHTYMTWDAPNISVFKTLQQLNEENPNGCV